MKAVIFDLDGTLVDTLESIAYSVNKTLILHGLQALPLENYRYYVGNGADTLIRRVLEAQGEQHLVMYDKIFEAYMKCFEEDCTYHIRPYEGIVELLTTLKANSIKTGIISNKPHRCTVNVVQSLFEDKLFDIVLGKKEGNPKKPDPSTTLFIAKTLGVTPEECIYVGDTNVDMITGNSANMFTVGVLWGFRDEGELIENHAKKIISHPKEILELLN